MGDRLVNLIVDVNGNRIAASYQHWSASDWEQVFNLLIKNKEMRNPTKEYAYDLLKKSIDEYNNNPEMIVGLAVDWAGEGDRYFKNQKTREFRNKHPETHDAVDRNDGLITFDEDVIDDWLGWAEAVNEIQI